MARFIAYRGKRILFITDRQTVARPGTTLIEVPNELGVASDADLVEHYHVVAGSIVRIGSVPADRTKLKVAFVGVWRLPCGIATYSEKLWFEKSKLVGDWKIFCERPGKDAINPLNMWPDGSTFDPDKIVPCWKRGEPLSELVDSLRAYAPDVVFIQHEYGIWPDARHWLAMMSQLHDMRVIVTMHSVYHHSDKAVVEAATPEIIVHSDLARDVLKHEKKISGKVHVILHGCDPNKGDDRHWNLYRTQYRFMQFGFGFRYKNFGTPIEAAAILKEKYPSVFFTGLFSESLYSRIEHDRYAEELYALIDRLGVRENVAIVRGFQSDATIDTYLRTNLVAVFAYQNDPAHVVYGCSGAARVAMSAGVPIVVSRVPHFFDLEGVVPKAETPAELATAIARLFDSTDERQRQITLQNRFIHENNWEAVAKRHIDIL